MMVMLKNLSIVNYSNKRNNKKQVIIKNKQRWLSKMNKHHDKIK